MLHHERYNIRKYIFNGGKVSAGLLKEKKIVVMGVANQRSIAWGIAKSLEREGANLIFTNRQESSYKRLQQLLEKNNMSAKLFVTCDVANDESIEQAFLE